MRHPLTRTVAVTALATGVLAGTVTSAAAYQPSHDDVTDATVTNMSAPGVVNVTRLAVETSPNVLAYQYFMEPTVPDGDENCELLRDGVSVLDEACTFFAPIFEEALRNPASGRYTLRVDRQETAAWTYTAPNPGDVPPPLGPSGCTLTGFKIDRKPVSVKSKREYGTLRYTYTFKLHGKVSGPKSVCKNTSWSGAASYNGEDSMGFTTADLVWHKKHLKRITFASPTGEKLKNVAITVGVYGTTPGWRANIIAERTLKF